MGERVSWDDRLNPVTVKEIRQQFSGWMMLPIMLETALLILGGLVCLSLYEDRFKKMSPASLASFSWPSAPLLFVGILVIPVLASLMFLGLVVVRHAHERSEPDLDVGNFSCLSPWRLVSGRYWAVALLAVYSGSLALPVLTLMYCLFGISLSLVLELLIQLVPFLVLIMVISLFFSASGMGPKLFLLILYVLFQFFVPGAVTIIGSIDLGIQMAGRTLIFLSCVWSVMGCVLHMHWLSAEHSNSLFGVKSCALALLAVCMVYAWQVYPSASEWTEDAFSSQALTASQFVSGSGVLLLLLLAISSITWRQESNERILCRCPSRLAGRVGYFLLSNIWGGSWLLAFLLLAVISGSLLASGESLLVRMQFLLAELNLVGYVLFYSAVIQWLLHRLPALAFKYAVQAVFALFCIIPVLVYAICMVFAYLFEKGVNEPGFSERLWRNVTITSPAQYVLDFHHPPVLPIGYEKLYGLMFAVLGLLIVLPRIWGQFRNFRKPADAAPEPVVQKEA